jgi:hypothetical protein
MRSAASKTTRKLQLDLPLDQACVDPSSIDSVSPVPRTEGTPDATLIAGQPDRPISFPITPERVVATLPEERSRETKLRAGVNTDTNRNLYHSLGTEQDADTNRTKLTGPAIISLLGCGAFAECPGRRRKDDSADAHWGARTLARVHRSGMTAPRLFGHSCPLAEALAGELVLDLCLDLGPLLRLVCADRSIGDLVTGCTSFTAPE